MEDPQKRKPLGRALAALIVASLGIASYLWLSRSPEQAPSGLDRLRIADGSISNSALLYVALEKGFFEREGLQVSCRLLPSGKDALHSVEEGKADLATVADVPVMFAAMRGVRIQVLATISSSTNNNALIARRDRGVSSPSDLRGKKIGVAPGTTGEYFLDTFLNLNRISRNEIEMIGMQVPDMAAALARGEVDAVVSWDPYAPELEEALGANGLSSRGEGLYGFMWNLVAMQDLVRKKPETVRKVLRALLESEAFIREEPEEALRIAAQYLRVEEPFLRKSWHRVRFNLSLDPILVLNMEDQARWAIRQGLTNRKNVANFLDRIWLEGLRSICPEVVTILY
ncbi:MAG: NrtA/SsuA/CpmA family ABC transporter substrate-binding protein [bacterium]